MPEVVAEGRSALSITFSALLRSFLLRRFTLQLALLRVRHRRTIPVRMSLLSLRTAMFVLALRPNLRPCKGNFLVNYLHGLPASITCHRAYAPLMTAGHLFKLNLSRVSAMTSYHNSWFALLGKMLLCRLPNFALRFLSYALPLLLADGCSGAGLLPYCTRSHVSCHTWHCLVISVIIFLNFERYIHSYAKVDSLTWLWCGRKSFLFFC